MQNTPQELTINGLTISPDLFRMGYPEGAGPGRCSATCCEGGVLLDVTERDRILAHRELVKRHMDETQNRDDQTWFETEEREDGDFPSGRCVGTELHSDRCVFQDQYGRCSIQVASTEEGMGPWALKPHYCILFPIEVSSGVVGHDDMLQDERPCCSVRPDFHTPVFLACRQELTHLLGADGFATVERHYQAHYANREEKP